jgi:hypothetical protein
MKGKRDGGVTMAIAAATRGFGYVAFESRELILDWGRTEIREKDRSVWLVRARALMRTLRPSVLVVEDVRDKSCKRSEEAGTFINRLGRAAKHEGIGVVRVSRLEVLTAFTRMGAHNKDDIAAAIAKLMPELAPRLPRRRRIWENERYSMAIFEAAALALTYFARNGV